MNKQLDEHLDSIAEKLIDYLESTTGDTVVDEPILIKVLSESEGLTEKGIDYFLKHWTQEID